MAQTQNYEVYYDIKVNATEGTEQVTAFANAVEKLSKGRISFAPVVTNINEMMQAVEKTFRGKNGKKKDFNFDLEIRTGETEKRLEGVKNLLTEIKELTQGIKLTINPGEKIDGRALRNQTNKLVGKKNWTSSRPRRNGMPLRLSRASWTPSGRSPVPSARSTLPSLI